MALLAGSPAIDHALASFCPATDQRGRSRPFGAACDVGAFESSPPYTIWGTITGYIKSGLPVYSGSTSAVTTATGNYIFSGLAPGNHTLTPSLAGIIALPNSQTISLGPDALGVNFKTYRTNAFTVEAYNNSVMHLIFAGTNTLTYEVQTSTNLPNWLPYSTNNVGPDSVFHLYHTNSSADPIRFFRAVGD